ncbi:MAG TPA: hypothetical protein VFT26_02640, partial [Pyrinomonadaceae bacterium]|nr:hypothetical protein [Pyrinomonadaceae bacterium]
MKQAVRLSVFVAVAVEPEQGQAQAPVAMALQRARPVAALVSLVARHVQPEVQAHARCASAARVVAAALVVVAVLVAVAVQRDVLRVVPE